MLVFLRFLIFVMFLIFLRLLISLSVKLILRIVFAQIVTVLAKLVCGFIRAMFVLSIVLSFFILSFLLIWKASFLTKFRSCWKLTCFLLDPVNLCFHAFHFLLMSFSLTFLFLFGLCLGLFVLAFCFLHFLCESFCLFQ